jgi:hypothetical protein
VQGQSFQTDEPAAFLCITLSLQTPILEQNDRQTTDKPFPEKIMLPATKHRQRPTNKGCGILKTHATPSRKCFRPHIRPSKRFRTLIAYFFDHSFP